jgi:hypothetical protein
MTDTNWTQEWQTDEFEPDAELIDWIKSRPDSVKKTMLIFPPACLVRANRLLVCPAPGTIGVVYSYLEDGSVFVLQHPASNMKAQCDFDWLEVVGYHGSLTPEYVQSILELTDAV